MTRRDRFICDFGDLGFVKLECHICGKHYIGADKNDKHARCDTTK